ncbi:putative RING-H2 finger protein ATL21B [Primulina huaijiensis]|uniref:putative RING-H2 finger protein ATL21B n=1 Tax=Primulina huaijiensis TaxID=1492673 RepID=UPI003CC75943
MELNFKLVLLVFFYFSLVVDVGNSCPISLCGNSSIAIRYPFILQNLTPTNDCTYIKLTCNIPLNTIFLNLPYYGDFVVQNIDYVLGYIKLRDPGNCWMRRLSNLNISSSYFKVGSHLNYTVYVCPSDTGSLFNPISCLINSTNSTIATREFPQEIMENFGCKAIGSWIIPLLLPGQLKIEEIYADLSLILSWNATVCKDCQENQDNGGFANKLSAKIIAIIFSTPVTTLMALSCCSGFCFHLLRMIKRQHQAGETTLPTISSVPQSTEPTAMQPPRGCENVGLDESRIEACTETVVFGESGRNFSGNSNCCAICLENYGHKETIRLITKCEHSFHAGCVEKWLQKNGTCPVCRTCLCVADFVI